jgi:hypothetical protein
MSDESKFLKAVAAYNRSPSKTAAINIWEMYFGPDSRRPLRISQLVREALRVKISAYDDLKSQRDAKYGGLNPVKRIQRAMTADSAKAERGIFDAAAKEVERNLRLTGTQIALLDLTKMKCEYQTEKERKISEARLRDMNFKGDVRDLARAMQRADLTINFNADSFFSGAAVNSNGYLNMWMRGSKPGDNVDTRERNNAELNTFEQIRYQSNFDGQTRPLYAALNVGRRVEGAAGGYGCSYFVLKEAVKERSTYTPSDTFYISRYVVTDEKLAKLRGKIDPALLAALQGEKGKVIDDRERGEPAFNNWLKGHLAKLAQEKKLVKAPNESSDTFEDRKRSWIQTVREILREPGFEEKVVASYERLDRVVAYMEDRMLSQISTYSANPNAVNLKLPTYVEAQVHGAIDWARDVERMVIAQWELENNPEATAKLEAFSKKHRIPYSYIQMEQLG